VKIPPPSGQPPKAHTDSRSDHNTPLLCWPPKFSDHALNYAPLAVPTAIGTSVGNQGYP